MFLFLSFLCTMGGQITFSPFRTLENWGSMYWKFNWGVNTHLLPIPHLIFQALWNKEIQKKKIKTEKDRLSLWQYSLSLFTTVQEVSPQVSTRSDSAANSQILPTGHSHQVLRPTLIPAEPLGEQALCSLCLIFQVDSTLKWCLTNPREGSKKCRGFESVVCQ